MEVSPADNIALIPTGEPAKVVRKGEEDGPDKTKDYIGDGSSYTRNKDLEDSHVIHKAKYGSEVSRVK